MTETKLASSLGAGVKVAALLKEAGDGILALGEIGIGNTSAAALVAHAVTGAPDSLVGNGVARLRAGLSTSAMCWPAPMPVRPCAAAARRSSNSGATRSR